MTLPEHAICSAVLAQFQIRTRLGTRGVVLVTLAGIAPDLDTAAKLFGDDLYWKLHHAVGHNVFAIVLFAALATAVGALFKQREPVLLFTWCCIAGGVHCLTDALYWWGIRPLWPFSPVEVTFGILEYLDLLVLGLWLLAAVVLYLKRQNYSQVAALTLGSFALYVATRAVLPPPTGFHAFITGGWMYAAPQGTPVLDWW